MDAELTGDLLLLVGVHFDEEGLASSLGGGFGELGGHHLAGTAPGGPEVDDDGKWALGDERSKGGGAGHFDRCGDQGQIRFAGTAAALLADFGVGDAVGGAAGGTGQDDAAFVGFEV